MLENEYLVYFIRKTCSECLLGHYVFSFNMAMILLDLLLLLPLTSSYAEILLEPMNPLVFVGDCIVFTCRLNSTTLTNSSALYFSYNSIAFPQKEMTFKKTYVTFKKCFSSTQEKGTYLCKYSGSTEFFAQWVDVEEKLVPIPKDSIKCIISDWKSLNCTWSIGQEYIFKENLFVNMCFSMKFEIDEICKAGALTGLTIPRSEINIELPLRLAVIVYYRHQSIELKQTTYFNLNLSKPIKPTSVKKVQLKINNSCMYLKWQHRYYKDLFYHLILEEIGSNKLNFSVEETKFSYCELDPFMKYKLQIYALPKFQWELGLHSEPYVESFISNKSIPKHSPWITNGSFERDYSDDHSVTLFWKCLKRQEFGDEYVQYLVENERLNITVFQNRLKLKLSLNTSNCETIKIWAKNSIGQSQFPTSLCICDKSKVPGYPQKIETILINSTTVLINWEPPKYKHTEIVRYTVYGFHKQNYCSSNLTWSYVTSNQTSKLLSIYRDLRAYTFAVSTENHKGSSGLFWTTCYFTLTKPKKPVKFQVKIKEKSFIVEWEHYNCNTESAYISNYVVSYCVAIDSTNCHDKIQERNVSKTEKKYQLKDLPSKKYLVWVKSSTDVGASPVVTKELKTLEEDFPVIAVVLTLLALFLPCIALLIYIKGVQRRVDKTPIEYPIKTVHNYNSISSIVYRDSHNSSTNDGACDNSSISITAKLCLESSPKIDQNELYSVEKAMSKNLGLDDFHNEDIYDEEAQINSLKVQLLETTVDTDDKETEFTDNSYDIIKRTSSCKNNNDSKNDIYIRAISSFTCMNSSGYIADNDFVTNGNSDYISNSSDVEATSFGSKSYNCNSSDTVDKTIAENQILPIV